VAEDKWARWLKEDRWPAQRTALASALDSVRDKVLGMAQLQPGESVVDLGAGTGLLGLKAAETVGPQGHVIFLDISADALRHATSLAHVGCERFVVGDALACPIREGLVDAVVVRSLLIYIDDRSAAAREIARILKVGGRAAIYEPVNRRRQEVLDMTGFEDVAAAFQSTIDTNTLTNFDEHTLAADFRQAGFTSVEIEMGESRFPVNGKGWAHSFKHGAPSGYSAYDSLLAAGVSRQRADEFVAAGERQIGDRWVVMTCPAMYMLAVR
jgi:ubiquinone/menaquinone biosynthesis C-methylase UbiE